MNKVYPVRTQLSAPQHSTKPNVVMMLYPTFVQDLLMAQTIGINVGVNGQISTAKKHVVLMLAAYHRILPCLGQMLTCWHKNAVTKCMSVCYESLGYI